MIFHARLAQLVEHLPCKQDVAGSTPASGFDHNYCLLSQADRSLNRLRKLGTLRERANLDDQPPAWGGKELSSCLPLRQAGSATSNSHPETKWGMTGGRQPQGRYASSEIDDQIRLRPETESRLSAFQTVFFSCLCSSTGKSSRLLSGRFRVRILAGALSVSLW